MAKLMKIAQIGFVTFAMMIWTVNAIAQGVNAYFAANGFDSNPCTQAAPCLTLYKASAMSYPPGSTINFRGGDNFTGCWALTPTNVPGGGDKNNRIVVQSYGTGRATMVSSCSGNYNPQLNIAGISGVVVQNLKFQGDGATTEVGILIEGPGDTITIQNNEVTGFVFVSNVAGEILVLGLGAHGAFGCNSLNNIQVLDNSLHGASVTSRDENGIYGFGCGQIITNVHYAGNHVWNMGGGGSSNSAFSPNGVVANGVTGGLMEYNLVHDIGANQGTCGGPTGIMTFNAANIVIQFNEVYNVQPVVDQDGCDFVSIDFDGGTTNSIAQYNYTHDNAGAAWMICCGAGDGNVIRYNISENDDKYYKSGGVVAVWDVVFQIYNNTIWIPPVGTDPNHAQACYIFGFSGTFPVGVLIATISVTLAARTNGHGLVCRLRRTGAA